MTYVLYKVGKRAGAIDTVQRLMDHSDVEELRRQANTLFADPENLIGRSNEQLAIPRGQLQSNVVVTKAGGHEYHRYVEIRKNGGD